MLSVRVQARIGVQGCTYQHVEHRCTRRCTDVVHCYSDPGRPPINSWSQLERAQPSRVEFSVPVESNPIASLCFSLCYRSPTISSSFHLPFFSVSHDAPFLSRPPFERYREIKGTRTRRKTHPLTDYSTILFPFFLLSLAKFHFGKG